MPQLRLPPLPPHLHPVVARLLSLSFHELRSHADLTDKEKVLVTEQQFAELLAWSAPWLLAMTMGVVP